MTNAAVFTAIRTKFGSDVATPLSLSVLHDNAPPPAITSTWYQLEVQVDGTERIATNTTEGGRYRIAGNVVVSMFAPVARGDAALLTVADAIVTAFRGAVGSNPIIYYGVPSLVGDAARGDAWFQRIVTIPFEADVFG